MNMSQSIPEPLKKYLDPSEPRELRLTAAKGLIPLSPAELTQLLYLLTEDDDGEISKEAAKSLSEIPRDVISTVLSNPNSQASVLDYFGRVSDDESQLEKIIVNNSTDDLTIAYLAEHTDSQRLLELISNNHQRIVRSSDVVEALSKNPMVSRSTLDSVIDYLRLYLGEDTDIPGREDDTSQQGKSGDTEAEIEHGNSYLDSAELDEELLLESDEEEGEEEVVERENIQIKISKMTIGERIKLAIKGNRESRTALIRDHNRIVSRAVLKNPRFTDTEVVLASQSKIVNEDILREISDTRRWVKMYPVKLALVTNPKTPSHISVHLIRHLRDHDLRSIMWSKNLPGVITSAARNIMHARRDRK